MMTNRTDFEMKTCEQGQILEKQYIATKNQQWNWQNIVRAVFLRTER